MMIVDPIVTACDQRRQQLIQEYGGIDLFLNAMIELDEERQRRSTRAKKAAATRRATAEKAAGLKSRSKRPAKSSP